MGHEKRIIEAFDTNGIERILLIDDVYDPPALVADEMGPLLDFLESTDGKARCAEIGLEAATIAGATEAALNNRSDDDDLEAVQAALFDHFLQHRKPEFDPGGRFTALKSTMLDVLAPLIALLGKCQKAKLSLTGLNGALDAFRDTKPHVVFLDYFLGADVPATGQATTAAKNKARKASIDLLGRLLAEPESDAPAVVLMSSREMKEQAGRFRQAVDPGAARQVMALRFRFMQKNWVTQDGKVIKIANDAADALLDTSQGFEFGSVLQRALVTWRAGAEGALKDFLAEIGSLDPKDFAYLFRFRLLSEGQRMSDYLEWIFGEGLKSLVDEKVNWGDNSFARLDETNLSRSIEGAFDGPSLRIARMFDRIRVNHHESRPPDRYQLGDVYLDADGGTARVVITPDCDLVPRDGKPPNAQTVLTMAGTVRSFDKDATSADQFVFPSDKPRSVKWNAKDIRSSPFDGPDSLRDEAAFAYYGTFRPIYAQEVQRQALTDLSRVGLAVSPVMGVDATVSAHLRIKGPKQTVLYEKLKVEKSAIATIILARGDGKDGHLVLFRRPFVNALLEVLNAQDRDKLDAPDAGALENFLKESSEGAVIKGMLTGGSAAGKTRKGPLGMKIAIGTDANLKADNAWLHLMLDISPEGMNELIMIDPTLEPLGAAQDDQAAA